MLSQQLTMDIKTDNISVLLKCLGNGEDVVVECSPFEIGRCRSARLIIPSVNISRNHCKLRLGENEAWIMEDMSSSGTFLNDELVGKGKTVIIKNNDIIRLGPKDCNFIWQFKEDSKTYFPLRDKCDNIGSQSQSIVEICNKKDSLQRKIIQNREHHLKMKIEKEKLHMECLSQVKALEERLSTDRMNMENQSHEIQIVIEKMVEEEKKKVQDELEQKLLKLQEKINENNSTEEDLKLEIHKLQEKLGSEQLQWENKFLEEKKILEKKIKEQNERLATERLKVEEMSLMHGQELKDKLKKEEEEKRLLLEKLKEMEKSKEFLLKKLKESDEMHLLEKTKLEEEMKQKLRRKEENIKALFQEQIDSLQKNQNECDDQMKAEVEDNKYPNNQHLLLELDRVKNTLIETESRQKLLEKELAQAACLQNEASKVKLNILENIADLMETELQCSVCSELFVTAITLNCTHTFCKYCIDMWKKKKKNCPICRKKITSENRSIVMDNYIDKMVGNLSEEFKNRRMAVVAGRSNVIPAKKKKTNDTPFLESPSGIQSPMGATQRNRGRGINVNQNVRLITRPSHSSR